MRRLVPSRVPDASRACADALIGSSRPHVGLPSLGVLGFDDTGDSPVEDAPPLVLIHGWAANRSIWQHVVPMLAPRRVIAVDVPGFGMSTAAGDGFELEAVAEAIWDGLPTADPVVVIGHSMGGAVALQAAALAPERVAGLVLCAPAGLLRQVPPAVATLVGVAGQQVTDLRRRFGEPLASSAWGRRMLLGVSSAVGDSVSEDDVRAMVQASEHATRLAAALATVVSADLRPLLKHAPASLGAISGAHDRVIPPEVIDVIREARPDVCAELVPGTGHVPMVERPAAFTAVLRQVLARLDDVHSIAT